jgi:beta-galactosidase
MDECAQWKLASLYAHCVKTEVQRGTGEFVSAPYFGALQRGEAAAASFTVRFTYALPMQPAAECRVTYTVLPDGRIETALDYDKVAGLPDMPDFAMIFTLSADYSQVRYYGRGPAANYCDRQEGARLGVFQTTAAEAMEPYLCPQECGSHGDVRWIEVADHRGRGLKLMLENGQSFEASALPYSPQELEQARHGYDLPSVQHTFLRASAGQCGVGGDDTWGAPVLAEYKKRNQTRHFAFAFRGI